MAALRLENSLQKSSDERWMTAQYLARQSWARIPYVPVPVRRRFLRTMKFNSGGHTSFRISMRGEVFPATEVTIWGTAVLVEDLTARDDIPRCGRAPRHLFDSGRNENGPPRHSRRLLT